MAWPQLMPESWAAQRRKADKSEHVTHTGCRTCLMVWNESWSWDSSLGGRTLSELGVVVVSWGWMVSVFRRRGLHKAPSVKGQWSEASGCGILEPADMPRPRARLWKVVKIELRFGVNKGGGVSRGGSSGRRTQRSRGTA